MADLVFASGNEGKIVEVKQALLASAWNIKAQSEYKIPEVPETGLTFIENALIKARNAAKYTKLPALADDSGLVVDALNGAPGIFSARYAGEAATAAENNNKLLAAMKAFREPSQRKAYFVCVMVLLQHAEDPMPKISLGYWHGQIALAPSGAQGHGYDPIFYLPELQCTAAEISLEHKNQLSHRAAALEDLCRGCHSLS